MDLERSHSHGSRHGSRRSGYAFWIAPMPAQRLAVSGGTALLRFPSARPLGVGRFHARARPTLSSKSPLGIFSQTHILLRLRPTHKKSIRPYDILVIIGWSECSDAIADSGKTAISARATDAHYLLPQGTFNV